MAEAIDTRVVEAKFDSKEFEKGVNKTVKKLDELKKSLNLDESGKSLAQLASKTQEATDKASSALEKLENRITSFTGMLKQKLLSGIADEIVGMVFKVRNSITGMFNSISTAQVGRGMQRYEDMLTSIRTMIANGASESGAYKAIEELNMYADQTSYSIDQLVNLLSQLKTGGVDSLETATQMVEGLSNAAAAAGVNAQRAGIAYYNFAQAYQKGAMLQQDWMSFQNIGMSGEKMNQSIIDAALKRGTLVVEKKDKQGNIISYKTSNKTDKMVKTSGGDARGITAQNMGSKLSSRWFNKAVMEEFTKGMYYFRDISPSELKKYTDLEKAIKEGKEDAEALDKLLTDNGLTRFAYDAFRAGQEARSFTDVLSTLKDVISRGWAKSFELIFGKLDDAKDFFTWLTENELASALYAVGEFRNRVLEIWSESGRADLLVSLENIDEIIGSILGNFTIFSGEEGSKFASRTQALGLALNQASNNFKNFTIRLKEWLDESRGGMSRAERLERFFNNIKRVIKIATDSIYLGFKSIAKIFRELEPVFDAVFIEIGTIAGNIADILNPQNGNGDSVYDHLSNVFENILKVARPLIKVLPPIIGFLGTIANFFIEMAVGTLKANLSFFSDIFGLILEIFTGNSAQKDKGKGVLDSIREGFDSIAQTCRDALGALSEFFSALIADARRWLGIGEENKDGGLFNNIANFFKTNEFIKSVRTWIKDTAKNVANWIINLPNMIWKGLKKLGVEVRKLWYKIKDLFFGKEVIVDWVSKDKSGLGPLVPVTQRIKGTFAQWLEDTINDIKDWFLDIPNKIKNIWNKIIDFFFGKKVDEWTREGTKDGQLHLVTRRIKSGFSEWMENLIKSIKGWVTSIPEKVKDLWKKVIEMIFGIKTKDIVRSADSAETIEVTTVVKEGLIDWIGHVANKVSEWYEDFKDHIKSIWNKVLDFIFGEKITVEEKDEETGEISEVHTKRVGTAFTNWISSLPSKASEWYKDFKDYIKSLWNKILDFILGEKIIVEEKDEKTDEVAVVHTKRVGTAFTNWIKSLPSKASEWYKDFKENIKDLWNKVLDFILGEKIIVEEKDEKTDEVSSTHTERVKKGFSKWLADTVENSKTWYKDFKGKINELWNSILKSIFGLEDSEISKSEDEAVVDVEAKADGFSEELATKVVNVIKKIPSKIVEGLQGKLDFFGNILEHANEFFSKKNAQNKASDFAKDISENFEDQEHPLTDALVSFGDSLSNLIMVTIPSFISEGFEYITTNKELWDSLSNIFSSSDASDKAREGVEKLGKTITMAFENLPDVIRGAVKGLKSLFTKESNNFNDIEMQVNEDGSIIDTRNFKKSLTDDKKTIVDIIKESFGSIGNAFTQLGPDIIEGLTSALAYVSEKITNFSKDMEERDKSQGFFEWLGERIFGKDKNASAIAQSVSSLGETIKNIITTVIPQFIGAAVGELVVGVPKFIKNLFGNNDKAKEEVKENSEKVGNDVGENVAEAMLSGYQQTLKEVGDKGYSSGFNLGDLISGFFISSAGAEKAIKESQGPLLDFVNSAKESAFGGVKKAVDDIIGVQNALKQAETGGTSAGHEFEGPKLFLEQVGDFLKTLGKFTIDNGALVAFGILIWGIYNIVDQLTFIDNVSYEAGRAAKWEAIKIAILGIVGIIGYLIYLSETGNEQQIKNVETVFDKVVSALESILKIITVMKGLGTAKSIFEFFTEAKGAGGLGKVIGGSLAKGAGYMLGGATVVGIAGDTITESLSTWSGNLTESFTKIGIGMDDLIKSVNDLASIADKIDAAKQGVKRVGELFEELKNIFIITPRNANMTDAEPLPYNYLPEFLQIINMFVDLSGAVSQFKTAITTYGANTTGVTDALSTIIGMKDKMIEFAEFAQTGVFDQFKLALMSIGSALEFYSLANVEDFNRPLEDWRITNAIGLLKQMFGNGELASLVQTVSEANKLDENDLVQNAEKLVIFAGALVSIGKACEGLNDNTTGNINELFTIINGLELPTDDAEHSITDFARRFGVLGNALGTFAKETSGLTNTNIANADYALSMVLRIAQGLKDTPPDSTLAKVFTGDKSLENFGIGIQALSGNLKVFFENIQNMQNGISTEYNRNNLEQVLMAVDSLTVFAARIAKVTYVNDYLKNADSWLVKPIGNITGLGTTIMNFISEINNYDIPENKSINFNFVYNAIDAIGKVCDVITKLPQYGDIGERVKNVKEILTGDGSNHKGVMGYLNEFFAAVIDIAQRDKMQFDLESISIIMTAYSEMVKQIVLLLKEINGYEGDALGVVKSTNPMEHLIPVFSSVNTNYSVFSEFLDNASKFDQNGIEKAKGLFSGLHDLAAALHIFSVQDTDGVYNVDKGLSKLLSLNWTSLETVKDRLLKIFNSAGFYVSSKSAGENIDAGLAEGLKRGKAIAAAKELADAVCKTFTVTLEIRSPSKVFEEFGEYLDAGLAQGMDGAISAPVGSAENMANEVVDTVQNAFDKSSEIPEELMEKARQVLEDPDSSFDLKRWAMGILGGDANPKELDAELKKRTDEYLEVVNNNAQTLSAMTEEEYDNAFNKKNNRNVFEKIGNFIHSIFHSTVLRKYNTDPRRDIKTFIDNTVPGGLSNLMKNSFAMMTEGLGVGDLIKELDNSETKKAYGSVGYFLANSVINSLQDFSGKTISEEAKNAIFTALSLGTYGPENTPELDNMWNGLFSAALYTANKYANKNDDLFFKLLFPGSSILTDKEEQDVISQTNALAQAINDALSDETDSTFKPKITPVFDFSGMQDTWDHFWAGNSKPEVEGNLQIPDTSINAANGVVPPNPMQNEEHIKQVIDGINMIKEISESFSVNLGNIRFNIGGKDFVATIGPDMDDYLGRESIYVSRRV